MRVLLQPANSSTPSPVPDHPRRGGREGKLPAVVCRALAILLFGLPTTRSALILTGRTPTSGRETATQFVGTYVLGWELPRHWEFNAALGYGTASGEGDDFANWAPSVVLKVPVWERWNMHVEYFGIFSSGKTEEYERHIISPGIHCLITPNIEVGARVGWASTISPRASSRTSASAGASESRHAPSRERPAKAARRPRKTSG